MARPKDYKAIAIWGYRLHSFSPYIRRQQELACEENAPIDAIYKQADGTWQTVSGIHSPKVKREMEDSLAIANEGCMETEAADWQSWE